MKNSEIADIFRSIARILEIKGGNPFKIRAYERAAFNIGSLSEDIANYIREGRLREIPGIGTDLEGKINEFVQTGKIKSYEELKESIPSGVLELLDIPSVGPKTAGILYEKLKIKDINDLEKAIKTKKIEGVFGIKEKTAENIRKGIDIFKKGKERMSLAEAVSLADEFVNWLKKLPEVKNILPAGSLRRRKDTVRDIDLLVISEQPRKVMDTFVALPLVKQVVAHGQTKSSVRIKDGVQIDCRILDDKSFGAALLYFTGSKNFNIKLRALAKDKGLKLSEYGVFRGEEFIAGKDEQGIFKALGLPFIEPELREDNGEIESAMENELPRLVELADIKGDLHIHSNWSDGSNTIGEIAAAAQKKGYGYVAVTDHSPGLKVAGGLNIDGLKKKKSEIERLNRKQKNFRILFGAEVEIDSQGNLDYEDEILREFDIVVVAVHRGFKQSKGQMTKRLINVCKNKYAHIIAHPTARLWGARLGYELDFGELFKAARETNTSLEINSFPKRLDLNDSNSRYAKEMKVRLAVNTDAHKIEQLDYMGLGVSVARRGWLEKENVLNTLRLEELLKAIKK